MHRLTLLAANDVEEERGRGGGSAWRLVIFVLLWITEHKRTMIVYTAYLSNIIVEVWVRPYESPPPPLLKSVACDYVVVQQNEDHSNARNRGWCLGICTICGKLTLMMFRPHPSLSIQVIPLLLVVQSCDLRGLATCVRYAPILQGCFATDYYCRLNPV